MASDLVVKIVVKQVGELIAGDFGAGIATVAYGAALTEAEVINLVSKYIDGTADFSDYIAATAAVETTIVGSMIIVGAPTLPRPPSLRRQCQRQLL